MQVSNWSKSPLTDAQIRYAAQDAALQLREARAQPRGGGGIGQESAQQRAAVHDELAHAGLAHPEQRVLLRRVGVLVPRAAGKRAHQLCVCVCVCGWMGVSYKNEGRKRGEEQGEKAR